MTATDLLRYLYRIEMFAVISLCQIPGLTYKSQIYRHVDGQLSVCICISGIWRGIFLVAFRRKVQCAESALGSVDGTAVWRIRIGTVFIFGWFYIQKLSWPSLHVIICRHTG